MAARPSVGKRLLSAPPSRPAKYPRFSQDDYETPTPSAKQVPAAFATPSARGSPAPHRPAVIRPPIIRPALRPAVPRAQTPTHWAPTPGRPTVRPAARAMPVLTSVTTPETPTTPVTPSFSSNVPEPAAPPRTPQPKAMPTAPPPKAMPVQRKPQEKLVVYVEGPEKDRGIAVRTMSGTYVETGTSCGRKTYEKEGNQEPKVVIYYWDDRDGSEFRGWWFGNTLEGAQVWSRCEDDSQIPPFRGWQVPWNGPVQEDLRVEPEASRQEKDARMELDRLKEESTQLIYAAKKVQEKARLSIMKKQMDGVNALLQELAAACDPLRVMNNKLSALPKPNRRLSNNEVLEEMQEFGNRIAEAVSALKAEDVNVRRFSKEMEDERLRKEQEKLDDVAMEHFLPEISAEVNVAEDEVEKALITFSMLRSSEEEATALEALKLIEDALTQAQQALDDTKAKLKAKRGDLPKLKSSRVRGEVELQRLDQQLQSAQVKLKPLKTARQDWDHERRNKKVAEEVEQKIILAEVELDRLEEILKSQDGEGVTAMFVAEVQTAVKSSAEARKTMMMQMNSRKVQNSSALENLQPRVDSVQARQIDAEGQLQNLEERLTTDGYLEEVKEKFEAINAELRKMQDLLQGKDDGTLAIVKAAEELNVKLQQSFSVTKVFLSMKIVEVKRLTTASGVAALAHLQEYEEQMENSREILNKHCAMIAEIRAKTLLKQASGDVSTTEQKAQEMKEASRSWSETESLSAQELKEATERSLRLEREVNKAVSEARKVIACRQIEAKNKNTPPSFAVGLEQLQHRLVLVQAEVANQRKLYAIVEQRMKVRKMQQEIEQKMQPLEEVLQGLEKVAEKHELLLSEEPANLKDLVKELKTAEIKTKDLQLNLKPLARLIESTKSDGTRLRELQDRAQSTLTKLQRHSEACFVNDLLRDAADRLATSKSSAEEVERGAPTATDPVEAAKALTKWEKSIQSLSMSISSSRSELSMKRLNLQRVSSDAAFKAIEALNRTISEMEGLSKRLTELRSKASEDRRRLFQRPSTTSQAATTDVK